MNNTTSGTQGRYATLAILRVSRAGRPEHTEREVQQEALLTVNANGVVAFQLRCSPDHLEELIVGRLLSEGFLGALSDLEELTIDHDNLTASIRLSGQTKDVQSWSFSSLGALSLIESLPHPIEWRAEDIFSMMDAFALDRTSHSRTRGTHSVYLWREGELLRVREDIGRHNAFDKLIGSALIDGIDLSECAIFTSSRVPTDLALKAIRSRVSLLVSKATVTDGTVTMAKTFGLTLLGNARDGAFDVFNLGRSAE